MALSDILQKITADYTEQAQKITETAVSNAEAFVRQVKQDERQKNELRWEKALERKRHQIKKATSKSGLRQRQKVLAAKKRLISEALTQARTQCAQLPRADNERFLRAELAQIAENQGEIVAATGRRAETEKVVQSLKKPFQVTEGDFDGGFIFRSGEVEINVTFERLFSDLRRQYETEIANILFG